METDQIPPAYSPGSFCGTSSQRNSCDSDFSDVFGGPPRRFSMPEVRLRYSFGEIEDEEERSVTARLLAEKPVFGEENVARRRRQRGADFFDDIFKGTGDQSSGSPRSNNCDRDNLFGPSAPGSRIMSPARPLLTKTESTSAQFSLPSKLNKAMEFPNSQYQLDNSTDGYSSPRYSSTVSLSRFSNQAIAGQDEIKTQVPKDINLQRNSRKDRKSSVVSNDNYFHFSIYKWAAKGARMIMPLLSRNKDISTFDRSASSNGRIESELPTEDLKVECERKEHSRSKQERQGIQYSIEKAAFDIFESISCHNNARDAIVSGEAKQKKPEKSSKSERKLLHEFLNEMDEQPEIKGNKTGSPNLDAPKNAKKNEGATTESDGGNPYKSSLQCADVDPLVSPVKNGVEEKIEDFVQVFNKEIYSRPKEFVQRRSESCRWTAIGVDQRENEVNENLTKDNAQKCSTDTKNPYSSEPPHWDSKFSVENLDDLFEDEFQVQELSDDLEIVADTAEDSVDISALDAQIRQWSVGKEGSIRSLLSTLQYVIWAGSEWKPIPLVDLIEANSVKKAYQKALLRLHPDKLQQKNVPSHQKYIAEKVFDLLQEAWDHFNNLAPL